MSGQLAQAAYRDYDALFSDAFASVREIVACCSELIKSGTANKEAQLVMDMGQASLYPLEQMRELFRSTDGASSTKRTSAGRSASICALVERAPPGVTTAPSTCV